MTQSAREVLARHMSKAQGQDPDVMTKDQPVWERYHGSNADGHLAALAAAGYPVEAMREALEKIFKRTRFQSNPYCMDAAEEARAALAKQEPQP